MAEPKSFYDPFAWQMEGAGGEVIGWAWEAGPFKDTTSTTEIPDGPGRLRDVPMLGKMAQIVVTAPLSTNLSLYNRYKAQRDATTGRGGKEPDVYEDLDFVQMDRDGSEIERFRVFDCVAIDYEEDNLNKKGTDKRTEKLTFAGSHFDRIPA